VGIGHVTASVTVIVRCPPVKVSVTVPLGSVNVLVITVVLPGWNDVVTTPSLVKVVENPGRVVVIRDTKVVGGAVTVGPGTRDVAVDPGKVIVVKLPEINVVTIDGGAVKVVGTSEIIVDVTGDAVRVNEIEVVDTVTETTVVGLGVIVVNEPASVIVVGEGVKVYVAEIVLRDTEMEMLVEIEREVFVAVVE